MKETRGQEIEKGGLDKHGNEVFMWHVDPETYFIVVDGKVKE